MIGHTGIAVSNFDLSKQFYTNALASLGYLLLMEFPPEQTGGAGAAGFGVPPKPDFWIGGGTPNMPPVHVAFHSANRAQADAFYKAAIAAGGRDNGAARTTIRTTTAPSCSIPTGIISRRSAIGLSD